MNDIYPIPLPITFDLDKSSEHMLAFLPPIIALDDKIFLAALKTDEQKKNDATATAEKLRQATLKKEQAAALRALGFAQLKGLVQGGTAPLASLRPSTVLKRQQSLNRQQSLKRSETQVNIHI